MLGLGLVAVLSLAACVAWIVRRSGAASTSAQGRSGPPAGASYAPAPEPPSPRARQRDVRPTPVQPAPGRPPIERSALTAPVPEDHSPPERPSSHVEEGSFERDLAEAPGSASIALRRTRPAAQSTFRQRLQPGLCPDASEASQVRETLISRFHSEDWGRAGRLYVDPRLPEGAHLPLLHHLRQAEREVFTQLGLEPQPPDVFAYLDKELLVAAACTNRNVVAYYDGALHVVMDHEEIQASVVHEYTHHALMSQGILGPAWAQEGIAMLVAREAWWLAPARLGEIREAPMPLEVMEQSIPYTLRPEQAVLFYVQAASMVACMVRGDGASLRGLMDALGAAAGAAQGEDSYDPALFLEPSAWQRCIDGLMSSARSAR